MRLFLLSWIGLALTMAGCCSHESAPQSETSAKSADAECKTGECCSGVSRSSLLTKSSDSSSPRPGGDATTGEQTK